MCLNGRYQFSLSVSSALSFHVLIYMPALLLPVWLLEQYLLTNLCSFSSPLNYPNKLVTKKDVNHIRDSFALAPTSKSLYAAYCNQESRLQHLGSAEQYLAGYRKILRLNHLSGYFPQRNCNGTGIEHMDEVTCVESQTSDREAAGGKNTQNCIWRSTKSILRKLSSIKECLMWNAQCSQARSFVNLWKLNLI